MATPRRTAAALTAAALTLILAACSSSPGNPADAPGADETSLGRGGVPQASSPEPSPDPAPSASPTVADTAEREVHQSVSGRIRQADVEVDLYALDRIGGDLVELTLTIHVIEGTLTMWDLSTPEAHALGIVDMSAFELVDAENGRVHRVARDSEGVCVCSRLESQQDLWDGDSLTLSATFAAPPEGVDALDVRVPRMPTFTGVPLV